MLTPGQNTLYFTAAFIIIFFCVAIIIIGIIVVHDIPYKVASKRNNPQKDAIRCMSILGLIAFPLWLFSMVWAYMKTSPESAKPLNTSNQPRRKKKRNLIIKAKTIHESKNSLKN